MKRICISFGHFEASNGVSRSAIAIANLLVDKGYDVTLAPIFRIEDELKKTMKSEVHLQRVFGFYFRGFARIVNLIPHFILYWIIFGRRHYDLEIAFQRNMAIRIIGGDLRKNKVAKLAWIHTYDEGLELKKYYERIGKVICVSKQNANRLKEELPTVIADYIYNPIDETEIIRQGQAPIDLKRDENSLLFVSVGRHSPEKGYVRLLKIVEKLKYEGFKFKLWLIGDGPQHKELLNLCDTLGLQDVVTFTGATNNPHRYTSHADVFICSSYREGYSTACTEAVMLGIPVITTDVGGSKEIIDDSEAGIHCSLDDESLYGAMKQVLVNPKLVSEWKEQLKRTQYRFGQNERTKQLYRIIGETLNDTISQ